MPQRRPAVRAVPRLVEGAQLSREGTHLVGVEGGADHHARSARAHCEHGAELWEAHVAAGGFGEEGDELIDVGRPEDCLLGEGESDEVKTLRRRAGRVHGDVEA